jgi:beta-hydroxylase
MRLEDHVPNYIDLSTEARGLTAPDRWKSFFFYAYGEKIPENCARCPRTCALLTTIPGLKSGFFSILRPGAHLAPHRGHFAGILRYHLGLIIPDTQSCGLRVDGQVVHWREGASLIFDDSFIHEAWNESAASRVVLFVDFMRPLPAPLAALSHALVWLVAKSSVVQPGLRRLAIWNRHFATLWNRQAG